MKQQIQVPHLILKQWTIWSKRFGSIINKSSNLFESNGFIIRKWFESNRFVFSNRF
jgi:hypothetical protein